jgi:hypothetical protein
MRPDDEAGAQPDAFGRAQVAEVCRHHHDLARLDVEKISGGLIHLAVGLVVTNELSAQDAIPRQPGMLCQVRHQRNVAVRERRDDELLLEAAETADNVRPGVQPMPCAIERDDLGLRQSTDAGVLQDLVENHSVEIIEPRPRQLTLSHPVHAWGVLSPPGVGECGAVHLQTFPLRQQVDFPRDRRAPVDHGTEHVKDKGLDRPDAGIRPLAILGLCACHRITGDEWVAASNTHGACLQERSARHRF